MHVCVHVCVCVKEGRNLIGHIIHLTLLHCISRMMTTGNEFSKGNGIASLYAAVYLVASCSSCETFGT